MFMSGLSEIGRICRVDREDAMEKEIIRLEPMIKEYIWGREEWLFSSLHPRLSQVPFLIKEIVANDALSLQVHPGDDFAKKEEGSRGKTEMWYILDCEPGAFLYYGLKYRADSEEIAKRIENQTILEICQKVVVTPGDIFYLPAGVIHAIGGGIRLLEVQQNSDITYRLYDYERTDRNNMRRPLHLPKALQVSDYMPPSFGHQPMNSRIRKEGYAYTLLVQCAFFKVVLYEVWEELYLNDKMHGALVILEGEGKLHRQDFVMEVKKKDCLYLPQERDYCIIKGKLKLVAISG